MTKITQLEIIEDTLCRPQPGMPPLNILWKDWVLRRVALAKAELQSALQRAVNAEMELLALKSPPIPDHIRAKMDEDRARMELLAQKTPCKCPEWLSQALNEGDGTYKP